MLAERRSSWSQTAALVAAPGLLALAAYVVFGGYVTTDPAFSLVWGREIAHGHLPEFVPGPTPHPLSNALGAIFSLWSAHSEAAVLATSYLGLALIIGSVALIAEHAAGLAAGVVAALLVVTREPVVAATGGGYLDIPYTALVLCAIAVEVRRPKAGTPVLVLLAVAGLLRPEAWFLAAMYWLWILDRTDVRSAVRSAVLVAIPVVIWLLADELVTGDALFSLHGTTEAANTVALYRHGPEALLDLPGALRSTAKPAVLLGAVIGLALLFWQRRPVALAMLAIGCAVAVATLLPVLAGTLLNPRYLLVLVGLICALAGAAVGGALSAPPRPKPWAIGSAVAGLAILVTAPAQVDALRGFRDGVAGTNRSRHAVKSLVTRDLPCGPLIVPNGRLVPFAAIWRDADRSAILPAGTGTGPRGTYVYGTREAMTGVVLLPSRDGRNLPPAPPTSARPIASAGGWTLAANCG